MFRIRTILCAVALIAAPMLSAATIEVAYSEYRETGSFQRIQEFFTGREAPGRRTIIRTDPDNRDGQYFLINLTRSVARSDVHSVEIEVITTESKDTQQLVFLLSDALRVRGSWIYCGVTGDDWPNRNVRPLAWIARLKDSEGRLLDEWESFVQRMP
ncbi:MAG: hypothetical protein JJU20_14240 [Opitutales bacterium]|nr:hypothetical protein [Opitutales bacterium]